MDASNTGLCALDTSRREYIRLQYSDEECAELQSGSYQNSINVREIQSAVLAALLWGPHWQNASPTQPTHVQFHIDNMSAVSWASRRYSRHPTAQLYNRLIAMVELKYGLFLTAIHIPGKLNTMTDAGSRAWTESHPLWATWSDLSCAWTQRVGAILCSHALARSSNMKYNANWKQWRRFCKLMGWHTWLPDSGRASSNKLIYFVIYLWKYGGNNARRGNQHNTIQSKLSSVIWYHRRYCGLQLRRSPQMTILLQGIKRMSDPVRKKQPVTPAFLRLLRRSLNFTQPRDRLLVGSVLIGYFFLLRRSEYLAIGKRRSLYCLQTKDVFFADSNGNQVTASSASAITIGLRGAKNDQYGRGSWRTMHHLAIDHYARSEP
ncbi:hypothetical protein PHYSODRAFT_472915 [Phytophthora sojae]|uniref:Uncharacterized protein n=1 Tax=Phytophthora sojae (strain P6497) TaxID=1094619 RepID=G4YI94_PHYSP|nr:hypothetical protein PHYSODRAFT_472915 [Phytophthora sojae]EGZ27477.1 hypothetical protein PHYSODRAFT_472915 [Phytophthora sojae]|eukprot:XP_009514752.1 hypothetical protein PHYSODRAFT_472915 [Phytophthora sojae]